MFYCEACRAKHGYEAVPAMNLECCEMCGNRAICYNAPDRTTDLVLKLPTFGPSHEYLKAEIAKLLGWGFSPTDRLTLLGWVVDWTDKLLREERQICAAIAEQAGEQRSPKVAANLIRGRSA